MAKLRRLERYLELPLADGRYFNGHAFAPADAAYAPLLLRLSILDQSIPLALWTDLPRVPRSGSRRCWQAHQPGRRLPTIFRSGCMHTWPGAEDSLPNTWPVVLHSAAAYGRLQENNARRDDMPLQGLCKTCYNRVERRIHRSGAGSSRLAVRPGGA